MIAEKYYYLILMLVSVAFPFAASFDKKVNFSQYYKFFFPASFIVASCFIVGDMILTSWGVWGFNESYHLPYLLYNLPYEEVSFFILVPYACLFLYEVIKAYFSLLLPKNWQYFSYALAFLSLVLAFVFRNQLYTTLTLLSSGLILLFITYKNYSFSGYLLLAYVVSILPFTLVNGFLTGMFTQEPIVWYNNAENLGWRFFTIPIEDFSYSFNLIALNILVFEYLKKRKKIYN
jgi:lycopene cyclase domain-containing protein